MAKKLRRKQVAKELRREHREASKKTKELNITLPMPPSINRYWGLQTMISKAGKTIPIRYVTYKAKEYKSKLEDIILKAYPNFGPWMIGDGTVKLQVIIRVYPATRREEDVDNRIKPLLDALEGVIYENDNQIKYLNVTLMEPMSPGNVSLHVKTKSWPPITNEKE